MEHRMPRNAGVSFQGRPSIWRAQGTVLGWRVFTMGKIPGFYHGEKYQIWPSTAGFIHESWIKTWKSIWWSSNGNFETIKACFFWSRDFQTNSWSNLSMVDTWMVCGIVDQSYLKQKWHENLHIHSRTIALSCLAPINWTCLPEEIAIWRQ